MNAKPTGFSGFLGLVGLLAMLLAPAGCGRKEEKTQAAPSGPGENPITAPVDYLGAVAKGKQQAERKLDTAALKKAIDLFQAQEGRFPKSLNELVGPDYLRSLPQPPAGMKFDYNPSTGEIKVVPR